MVFIIYTLALAVIGGVAATKQEFLPHAVGVAVLLVVLSLCMGGGNAKSSELHDGDEC